MTAAAAKSSLVVVLPTLNGGGAEKVVVDLARALRKDWEIRFRLTSPDRSEDVYAPVLAAAGVPVERLPVFRKFATLRKLLPLRRALLRAKPDVVFSALTVTNAVVSLALRGTKIPHVMNEHNDIRAALVSRIGHPAVYRLLAKLAYRAPNSKCSVAVSSRAKESAEELFGPKTEIRVVHNGLDLAALRRAAEEPVPDDAGWDGPRIAAVGRLNRVKNLPLLMRAVAHGGPLCQRAQLLLVGRGEEEGRLRALAAELGVADRVLFLGFRANPHAWVARADLFAMSSDSEGFPCALAEAMFVNGHCVTTANRGSLEIVKDGKSGLAVPVGDEKALSEALERMLSDEELRARCAAAAREWALSNTLEKQTEAYDEVLRAAAGFGKATSAEVRDG